MGNISGTNLAAAIVPFTTEDQFPTHYSIYGKGGHKSVSTIAERDAIFQIRREEGMTVWVIAENKKYVLKGGLTNEFWTEESNGGGGVIGNNTQILFNNNGVVVGDDSLTYNKLIGKFKAGNSLYTTGSSMFLHGAGNSTTNGFFNLGIGTNTLGKLTSGEHNLGLGLETLAENTIGSGNVAVGFQALNAYTGAGFNFALGYKSGLALTNGEYNLFLGSYSGYKETNIANRLAIETLPARNDNKDYLIEGDFSQRWVRINGGLLSKTSSITSTSGSKVTTTVSGATSSSGGLYKIPLSKTDLVLNELQDRYFKHKHYFYKIHSNDASSIYTYNFVGLINIGDSIEIIETKKLSSLDFNTNWSITLNDDFCIDIRDAQADSSVPLKIDIGGGDYKLYVAGLFQLNGQYQEYRVYDSLINYSLKIDKFGFYSVENKICPNLKEVYTAESIPVITPWTDVIKLTVPADVTIPFVINDDVKSYFKDKLFKFELDVNMTTISVITWPESVVWVDGAAPTFDKVAHYRFEFRTEDAGETWIAKLIYTYVPHVETDLDILKKIRANNPNSQLPSLWNDSNDPYSQWTGVAWNNEKTRVIGLNVGEKNVSSLEHANKLTELRSLNCSGNQLTYINVSGLTLLASLQCFNNSLTSLNVTNFSNLVTLDCSENQLHFIDVTGLSSLVNFYCNRNQLASLDLRALSHLADLTCDYNQLTSLKVSNLASLSNFVCTGNQLTSLDLSGLTSLSSLYCDDNKLTSINVSGLTSLTEIYCNTNQITSLDASGLSSLATLNCSTNKLTDLVLTGLTSLTTLFCNTNLLAQIPTLTSKGAIGSASFADNKLLASEVQRLISIGFTQEQIGAQNP